MKTLFNLIMFVIFAVLPVTVLSIIYQEFYSFFGIPDSIFLFTTNPVVGVLLLFSMLNTLFLGSRIKFLDKLVGFPTVLKVHKITAYTAFFLLLVHGILRIDAQNSLQKTLGLISGILVILFVVGTTLFMVSGRFSRLPAVKSLKQKQQDLLRYNKVKIAHNLGFFIATVVGFFHVLQSNDIHDNAIVYWIVLSWSFIVFAFYLKFVVSILVIRRKALWQLTDKQTLGSCISITLKYTGDTATLPTMHNGQYAYIALKQDSTTLSPFHPFSLVSSEEGEITFIIEPLNDFTRNLQNLPLNSSFCVDGAYGHFHLPRRVTHPLLCVASGVGITPFLGVVNEMNSRQDKVPLTLVWFANNNNFYHTQILEQAKRENENFSYHLINRETFDFDHIKVLQEIVPSAKYQVRICGGSYFVKIIQQALKNYPVNSIETESFQ